MVYLAECGLGGTGMVIVDRQRRNEFELLKRQAFSEPAYICDSAVDELTAREDLQEMAERMRQSFNDDQRAAFDRIVTSLENPGSNYSNFYIQGPGGIGKTFLYRALYLYFVGRGKTVFCIASSGIAALLLPNGCIAHSQFRIPLDTKEHSVCDIKVQSQLAQQLRQANLIVWDKVPMTSRYIFEAVDCTLRDVTKSEDSLFGGIAFV
ncbi:conserved hypothetical protein [Talaromyces stipitatus ATCC 10500]|uniref:ATP-dependent DNA helicase n=1 Tax=Talaromyces stipitatus (strain ATCC 10500 / CBS 375.48 / QM 6759 / NRRL 1006) TaxID=441959 RepID=B8MI29_TALSN|nr:uncharacterized protein TSTA_022450 [Talaromyces stipitatus ATCC 10500]EED17191.1 conserved hypothetical protein [Talaromyces stipitatus ATCC 10500]